MIFYNKETRNEEGKFYRGEVWGIEKAEDWDNGKGNFTNVTPPVETLKHGVPCDWDEKTGQWILDESSDEFKNLHEVRRATEYLKRGITIDVLTVALWEKLVEARPEAADVIEVERQEVKTLIPKPE